jgi:transposase
MLKEKIYKNYPDPNTMVVTLFDAAGYHRSHATQEAISDLGLRFLFNKTYSPELNMAEKFILAHKSLISKLL